jgi:hypothetical protein
MPLVVYTVGLKFFNLQPLCDCVCSFVAVSVSFFYRAVRRVILAGLGFQDQEGGGPRVSCDRKSPGWVQMRLGLHVSNLKSMVT